jgi:hypothetical protein
MSEIFQERMTGLEATKDKTSTQAKVTPGDVVKLELEI